MNEIQALTKFQIDKIPEKVIIVPVFRPITPCSTVEIRVLKQIGSEIVERLKQGPVYVGIFSTESENKVSLKSESAFVVHETGKQKQVKFYFFRE